MDEQEVVDAQPVEDGPAAELEQVVSEATAPAELIVRDPRDEHEVMLAMDAHDAMRFVDRIVRQAQELNLGKRWVYEIRKGNSYTRGLTVDAVQDITQQMNWTGRCRIHVLEDSLSVELVDADEGDGPEPFWIATVAARDDISGSVHVGTSMEPQKMKLRASTAKEKRAEGKPIPEDGKVFDRFSRAKAINKAQRNALEAHIPEAVKMTLLAMAAGKPELVERIETEAEARTRELPPPLATPEADELRGKCAAVYDEIRGLGGGQGAVLLTPGRYNGAMMHAQHSLDMLRSTLMWLEQRRDEIARATEAPA